MLSLIIGFILNSTSERSYGSNIYLKTIFNFGSQVFESIRELQQHENVDQDTIELYRMLNITPSQTLKLKGFHIMENTGWNTIEKMYSDYRQYFDSVSLSEVNYENYKQESSSEFLLLVLQISVESTDKFMYVKIENDFIKEFTNNVYLKEIFERETENLFFKAKDLEGQFDKTDYFVDEYLKIKVAQSKKPKSNGYNLYMGDA